MTQEQKARRYDEAKYIMKEYLESGNAGVIAENTIKNAFPELAESEDERIRKAIISFLKSPFVNEYIADERVTPWIAWLEKHADKVEQKHTPKHKVGDTIYYNSFGELKSMIVANVITGGTDNPMYEDGNGNAVFEKELIEQNLDWCEEDENTIQVLKNIVRHSDEIDENIYTMSLKEKLYDWLKSIKNRVQPKQEWSEEDEPHINGIIDYLYDYKLSVNEEDMNVANGVQEEIDWLKSLRPHNTWKPSDEQMKALHDLNLTGNISYAGQGQTLIELYNDLKKL